MRGFGSLHSHQDQAHEGSEQENRGQGAERYVAFDESAHQLGGGIPLLEELGLDLCEAGAEKDSYDGLTPREQEVLALIAEDNTNQKIANHLSISHKTVARHRENIMSKLNLHTRTELVKYAIRKGLISLDDM